MSQFAANPQINLPQWMRRSARIAAALGITACITVPIPPARALGQPSETLGVSWQRLGSILPPQYSPGLTSRAVRLDGRRLFLVAAPALDPGQNSPAGFLPIDQRVRSIELRLAQIAAQSIDPETLQVTSSIDSQSNLPIISINGQYLMTVTTLDAQLQGREPSRWADELTQTLHTALVQSRQERQPEFIAQQGLVAGGIVLVVLGSSWGMTRLQRRLKTQQENLESRTPEDPPVTPNSPGQANPAAIVRVHRQLTYRQQQSLYDIQRRLLQLGQMGIWGGGLLGILDLFPYTRWLQPLVLSAPLQIIGIILVFYVVVRLTDIAIDRFFAVFEERRFLAPEASQRLALRISTFSRVLKGLASIVWIGAGALTALSVIGVELGPVLAGAGIIGLAISFASQSLIKDTINGFLILWEDQYAVGDVIAVGTVAGLVEYMSLRITQVRNAEGRLITIPNSSITVVENLSKDWSRVDCNIDIAYGANLLRALEVIQATAQAMSQESPWKAKILEPPQVLGVEAIAHAGVTIKVWIKTQPLKQWEVAREFRRRLKLTLDREGIPIGVPQQSVWFRSSLDLHHQLATDIDSHAIAALNEQS